MRANQFCRFEGIFPNIEAAKKLGYKMGESNDMEGKVYERLTDACSFGLLEKARGWL
jgi:hypothetical protein